MDALYKYLSGLSDLSGINALLLCGLIWLVHYRIKEILNDLYWAKKQLREHEITFAKHNMVVERESGRS